MPNKYKVLKGGRLIDGTGKESIENSVIVMKNNLIESVGPKGIVSYPQDAELIEIPGATVMPGLIDAHVHLLGLKSMAQIDWIVDDPLLRGMRSVMDIWKLIDAGFTTVRDLGSVNALRLKQAVEEGAIVGPKIIAAGRFITQTGGSGDTAHSLPVEWQGRAMQGRIADGVAEVRKAAREQLREGADLLKIMTTGAVLSENRVTTSSQYSLEEIQAFVDEAHNAGVKTASHAHGTQGIKNSLICGIDSIEHGTFLDDECIDLMLKQNTYLVPTLAIFETIITRGSEAGVSESSINKARIVQETHFESFKKAYKAGVRCGLGSDYLSDPLSPMGDNGIELQLYVERVGLSPMETIVCATKNNAEALGVAHQIGTLEAGKWADLLVIQGNPSQDISILCDKKNIRRVYKGGIEISRLSPIRFGEPEQA